MHFFSKHLLVLFIFFITPAFAKEFPPNTYYEVCFTPGENCTQKIINTIDKAKQSIRVQAYSFTSAPIMKALIRAKRNGIDVRVILDKSHLKSHQYSPANTFSNQNIPVWIDNEVNIAHNKVMIIDKSIVITGSFNFTKAAQRYNAENVLIIYDKDLANKYEENWDNRSNSSQTFFVDAASKPSKLHSPTLQQYLKTFLHKSRF